MKKQSQTLYIIGNGFDLYHGIQSSYWNFKEYIKEVDSSLFRLVEDYLQIEENWSDLEEALASIDIDTLTEYASDFLVSYGAEDWSDAFHHDYQYEIDQVVKQLSIQLKTHFINWLIQLAIPKKNDITKKLLVLDNNALYLNFNYTDTLTKIYNVRRSNVLHIHGSLKKSNSIILGHGWKPKKNYYVSDSKNYEDMDTRVLEGEHIIENYFTSTFKPTKKIIKSNKYFFSKLYDIKKIIILGHSMSLVDLWYFKTVVKKIDKNKVKWKVSYHYGTDKVIFKNRLVDIGIPKKKIELNKIKKITNRRNYE